MNAGGGVREELSITESAARQAALARDSIGQLAVFGGTPAFAEVLHVGRPNIGDRERLMQRFNQMLDTRWLSNGGPFVQEFERRICELVGVKHCVVMCNATVALEIVTRALGLKGEVIVPSFTFVATAHALQWQKITPVFCDIDPDTHTIDPAKVERMITPRTTGILGVHLWGRGCDVDALAAIARRRDLRLLFDAAHAFGCTHNGRMIGGFGDAEVFSFHATKFFNTFEGGAAVTDDDDLADRMRLMRNFGFRGFDHVVYPGTNGKMSEVCAAMGLVNLEEIDRFVETNRTIHRAYERAFATVPNTRLLRYPDSEQSNYQYVVVEVEDGDPGLRDRVVRTLHSHNVLARRYFWPACHRMEPYRSLFPHAGLMLPNTQAVAERVIVLPTGSAMTVEKAEAVVEIIANVLRPRRAHA